MIKVSTASSHSKCLLTDLFKLALTTHIQYFVFTVEVCKMTKTANREKSGCCPVRVPYRYIPPPSIGNEIQIGLTTLKKNAENN